MFKHHPGQPVYTGLSIVEAGLFSGIFFSFLYLSVFLIESDCHVSLNLGLYYVMTA